MAAYPGLRALWALLAQLPDLPRDGRRDVLAARADRHGPCAGGRPGRIQSRAREASRPVPGVSGVPRGVSLRCGVRSCARGGARSDREHYERAAADRAMRWLVEHLFPYPQRLRWALPGIVLVSALGLSRLVRASGILSRLPAAGADGGAAAARAAAAGTSPLPEVTPAVGRRRGRRVADRLRAALPAARPQPRHGAGPGQRGIRRRGAPGAGLLRGAPRARRRSRRSARMARALIETFEGRVDLVVANAAGCGAAMKEYGHLLRDEAEWRSRAEAFSESPRCLPGPGGGCVERRPQGGAGVRYLPRRVPPCPRTTDPDGAAGVLRQIPELRFVELTESDLCCGSAGTYNLLQPEMANRLLARKVERIRQADTDFVAAGNIGCLLQIQLGLRQAGRARAPYTRSNSWIGRCTECPGDGVRLGE